MSHGALRLPRSGCTTGQCSAGQSHVVRDQPHSTAANARVGYRILCFWYGFLIGTSVRIRAINRGASKCREMEAKHERVASRPGQSSFGVFL
jgi:hypothetical protein